MLSFPSHLSLELVWRQKYTTWLMLRPSDESGLPSHVTRNTLHIRPVGPCLVLTQLFHVAIPPSHKDSLIPTEFQADERGHQKCCLFFFPATSVWLASLERQVTGAHLEIKEGQEEQAQAVGFGARGERGPARDNFHISPEDIKKTGRAFSLPSPSFL